jgi:hypothetical protein
MGAENWSWSPDHRQNETRITPFRHRRVLIRIVRSAIMDVGEVVSPVPKDLIDMLHTTETRSSGRPSRVSRLTDVMRRSWAEARYADRRLMELRTHISRHSG